MSMRGGSGRDRDVTVVSPDAFRWDRALIATLRHVSLPWGESLPARPLTAARDLGSRDRLSLLGQFAAHQAFLQFAGIADGELDPVEWACVPRRGSDIRLVRVAARTPDPSTAPPPLTLAQQFAEAVGTELEILGQSWARADAVYAEAHAKLRGNVAADRRWLQRAACGSVDAPGPDGLRTLLAGHGHYGYSDDACLASLERFADREQLIVLRGASPLERYSAIRELLDDPALSEAEAAERILAATSGGHQLFVVANAEAFDGSSRRVVELLRGAGHASWLVPGEENALPETRWFVVSPRLGPLRVPSVETFVQSEAFVAWLEHGEAPAEGGVLPSFGEPARSYVGALALLGTRIPRYVASRFLAEFLFTGTLEELPVVVDDGHVVVNAEARKLIPSASLPAIARVAAHHATGVDAALLWLDAGDAERAAAVLEKTVWPSPQELVRAFRRVPRSLLTPELARRYAHALIDCGRYRDARDLAAGDELVLSRAERRMGDYTTALQRLERMKPRPFDAELLRAELLRLLGRDASRSLDACLPSNDDERMRLAYERAVVAWEAGVEVDESWMAPHYLTARFATYRALARGDYEAAGPYALAALDLARCTTERIDAWLDRLFAAFSSGRWNEARVIAVEALHEVEETQGDRAAAGILFTLAYLAADDGQWSHAAQRIARLRHFYAGTHDERRLRELELLSAHLDFLRGRFADARRAATVVYESRTSHDQIREAAALILDEIDWMENAEGDLRSNGRSGNVELTRRHRELVARCSLLAGTDSSSNQQPATSNVIPSVVEGPGRVGHEVARHPPSPGSLDDARDDTSDRGSPSNQQPATSNFYSHAIAFRTALRHGDRKTAARLAKQHDLLLDPPAGDEVRILRIAATREFPYAIHEFDVPWCFATRNRLGQWNAAGSHPFDETEIDQPDWIVCSERERFYLRGSAKWPVETREAFAAILRARSENHRLKRIVEQEESARAPARGDGFEGLVGESAAMREVQSLVARVARRDVAVCILGESGTGKELVARAIHRHSARRQKLFTAINCAALPENLVESELFGHVRGAFTGADRDRAGLIETTDGGTLFLDEIGELPLPAQAKLLRFLQEGELRRVGDTVNRSADVRIVSATNRKLEAAVEAGQFRDDLYYRVRGVEIVLPALRERPGDLPLLAAHFLSIEHDRNRGGPSQFSADAQAIFAAYPWPGNVRELQNTIRAAHAMAGEAKEIDVEHLPERLRGIAPARGVAGSYQDAVTRFRRELIERSLLQAAGNQNRAASLLKMSRQALAYQIRELGILVKRA